MRRMLAAGERIGCEGLCKIEQQALNPATSRVMAGSKTNAHSPRRNRFLRRERRQSTGRMRNASIAAAFAHLAANRDEKLPRKPFPATAPAGRGSGQ